MYGLYLHCVNIPLVPRLVRRVLTNPEMSLSALSFLSLPPTLPFFSFDNINKLVTSDEALVQN